MAGRLGKPCLALASASLVACCVLAALLPAVAMAADRLPGPVLAALDYRDLPADSLSVYVARVSTGEPVLRWHDDEPRNPASVMKLLTTLAALDSLGPTYTWKTEVYLEGEVHEETLDGNLLLKGYGDPYLVAERLWQIVRAVRRAGIRNIAGDLLLDDSWFNVADYDPAAFDGEPLRAYNVAPNALMVNFKAVRYIFEPDLTSASVSLSLLPELDNLQVVNHLSLEDGRCRGYQRGITITANAGVDQMIFSGNFPSGCSTYSLYRTALSHNEFAYGMFKAMWRELGGELAGGWENVVHEGDDEPFMTFDSVPLSDVITMVNKHSNNVMARQILLTLAAEKYGPPGVVENGRKAVREWLESRELDVDELTLDNGAGLSRNARITAHEVGMLLEYAYDSRFMPEYLSSLSLAGLDGTLSRRLDEAGLTGMAHLKTGSMDDVTAIAGYLQSRAGERYIVVALQNHPGIHRGTGEEVQEALLRWLFGI